MARFEPHPTRRPVLVTGASAGIGAATARAFAALGHPVAIAARRLDRLDELAAAIRSDGGEAVGVAMDVGDLDSIDAGVRAAEAAIGEIDIVVSNAGDNEPSTVHSDDAARFARHYDVNVFGPQRLTSVIGSAMIERGRGDIVYVSSMNASVPRVMSAAYNSSKAALEAYARTAQMEFEGTGVRASIVRPGPTLTEMGWGWDQQLLDHTMREWQRWGVLRHGGFIDADDMAAAIVHVATAPRGMLWSLVELNPEAPLPRRSDTSDQSETN
ncbi:MAG: SDR family oxidoreductase [Microthrixaceae bacterium]|nr:SDR family oxidoreductase [Microthrixaceae bacterium]